MRLEIERLEKWFGGSAALAGVDLSVADSDCTVLVGPSGGGKSTLLRVLGGLLEPDAGRVAIDGEQMRFDERALLAHRRRVGTVFQAFNLFPHLSALRNIALPLAVVHGYGEAAAEERAREVLERFRLGPHAGRKPAELSGGQRQRVAIARAVSARPRLLLFDEPTSALDPEMAAGVLDLIGELRDGGARILLVTHQMAFARRVADHAVFLARGEVVEARAAGDFFGSPRSGELAGFLDKVMRY